MRDDPTSSRLRVPLHADGWLGTRELPGYRAGQVIARLDDLPEVDPHHLYFDLLLLDAQGRTQDNHSGPCRALARQHPLDERSRFVRVVAELVRHAGVDGHGLGVIARAVDFVRECGIAIDRLVAATQLLDEACSERAVSASLYHLLALSLGEAEARQALSAAVGRLGRSAGHAEPDSQAVNERGLEAQVSYIVRSVGKARARHYLRELTDFALVPSADMLGV